MMKGKHWLGIVCIGLTGMGNLSGEEVGSAAELKAALGRAGPGDEVVIRNGVYRNVIWEVDAEGAEGQPVVVRAQTPGKVINTGQSALRVSGRYVEVRGLLFTDGYLPGSSVVEFRALNGSKLAEHSRVTEIAIVNYSPPDRRTRLHWVSLYGRHNRLDHSYFSGMNNNGVTVVVWLDKNDPAPVNHRIDHNHFADRPAGGENGWETIRIGDSETSLLDARVTVENNLFTRTDGEIETISNKSCENVFRNNAFVETQGMLTLRHGDRCVVDGNWFIGNGRSNTGGIRVMGRDHVVINNYIEQTAGRDGAAIAIYPGIGGPNPPLSSYFAADRAVVAFNTIVGPTSGTFIDVSTRYDQNYAVSATDTRKINVLPQDLKVANNVMVAQQTGSDGFITGQAAAGSVFEGNVLWGSNPPSTVMPESGTRVANPQLVRVDHLWQPPADNPLAGTAEGLYSEVDTDIFGFTRGAVKDPGAMQTSGVSTDQRHRMPNKTTTGPSWLDAERDVRVVTWPLRPDFFVGAADDLVQGWLNVDWAGWLLVTEFPWIYHSEQGQWVYVSGPGDGQHWFFDHEWGWYYTDHRIYPFLHTANNGWVYYYGRFGGIRFTTVLGG
jgi:poly(beta-D-mannuronate) lyase